MGLLFANAAHDTVAAAKELNGYSSHAPAWELRN